MLELLDPVITLLDLCREDRQLPVSGLNLGIPRAMIACNSATSLGKLEGVLNMKIYCKISSVWES
jgi:hypothetical protein